MFYGAADYGGMAGLNFLEEGVQPGQTVPFRKSGDMDADHEAVYVGRISGKVGSIDLDVIVTRK